jgi:hypothetical protein
MKNIDRPVRVAGKLVATIHSKQPETLAEAIKLYGKATVIKLAYRQACTNESKHLRTYR